MLLLVKILVGIILTPILSALVLIGGVIGIQIGYHGKPPLIAFVAVIALSSAVGVLPAVALLSSKRWYLVTMACWSMSWTMLLFPSLIPTPQ